MKPIDKYIITFLIFKKYSNCGHIIIVVFMYGRTYIVAILNTPFNVPVFVWPTFRLYQRRIEPPRGINQNFLLTFAY